MFRLTRPSDAAIRAHLQRQAELPFSYPEVGATVDLDRAPARYRIDRNRSALGHGEACFEAARSASRNWRMFELGWAEICWPDSPIKDGAVVGVLAHTLGLWSLSACRIVYVIDEPDRFGFAYGTLPDHAGRGEERFLIEREPDGRVCYDLRAFSRPGLVITHLGYFWMRILQRRFARDSMAVMRNTVKP